MCAAQLCSILLCLSLLTGPSAHLPFDSPYEGWSADNTTLYVLMYHHLVEDPSECNDWRLTADRFRSDLQWLQDHGYTSVLPSDLVSGHGLPKKAVMITFDDGYASNYKLAFPLLKEYHAKAVISIITGRTDNSIPGFLTWDMCREMMDSGLVEIGSHTYELHTAQPVLGILRRSGESRTDYESRVFTDLQHSIDCIEEHLGVPPLLFAYPYGRAESWAGDFVAGHFAVSLTTQEKPADLSNGTYLLPRYNISMRTPPSKYLPA